MPFDAAPAAAPKARRVYRVGEGWEGTIPTVVPHSGAARATGSGSFKRRANSSNFVISTANEVRRAGRAPAAACLTRSAPRRRTQGRDESFVRRDSGGDATARWPSMPNPGVVGLALGSQEWQTF